MPTESVTRQLMVSPLLFTLFTLALIVPRWAHAYGDHAPLDVELLRPAPGDAKIFSVDLGRVGERNSWVPQVILHYADRPLVLVCQGQCLPRQFVSLIANRVTLHLSAAVSLVDRVQLALSVPVTLYQYSDPAIVDGQGSTVDNVGLIAPVGKPAGIGDAQVHAKVALLPRRWTFGLGIEGTLSLPSGDGNSFLGTSLPSFTARLLAHAEYKRLTVALNFGARFAKQEEVLTLQSGTALTYSLGGQVKVFGDDQEVTAFYLLAEIYGLAYARFEPVIDFPTEFLIAAKTEPGNWSLFAGVGSTLVAGTGTPNIRGLIGASYSIKRAARGH